MKKLLSVLICVCMLLCMFPMNAFAAVTTSGSCGNNLTWRFNNGVLTISGTGAMKGYYIQVNENEVKSTAPWEPLRDSITSVVVESGVTTIGSCAFYKSLTPGLEVTPGEEDTIVSISLPNTLTTIGSSAFGGCNAITSIQLPDSVTWIASSAFAGCASLESVRMPSSLIKIDDFAFSACRSLETINIPKNVTEIGCAPFMSCNSLREITVDAGNSYYSVDEHGALYGEGFVRCYDSEERTYSVIYTDYGIIDYPEGREETEYEIKPGTKIIADYAMMDGYDRTSVTIPDGVIALGIEAFGYNNTLKRVILPDTVEYIGSRAFCHCLNLSTILIPASVTTIVEDAFDECPQNLTICGYSDSYAEEYANENGINFIAVDKNSVINYDANGGTGAPAAQSKSPMESIDLSRDIPTRDGYLFAGWTANLSAPDSAYYVPGTEYSTNADITLYALWLKEADTYYVDDNGTGDGLSAQNPFNSYFGAVYALSGKDGTIVVTDTSTLNKYPLKRQTITNQTLTIKGLTANSQLRISDDFSYITYHNTKFENIKLVAYNCSYPTLNSTGGMVFSPGEDSDFDGILHVGGIDFAYPTDSKTIAGDNVVINSGRIRDVYAAGAYFGSSDYKTTGDISITINGGIVGTLKMATDTYSDSFEPLNIGGNLNIIHNGGTIGKMVRVKTTAGKSFSPNISGALNIIFNNGNRAPQTFGYPDTARLGTYIIYSAVGGVVEPATAAGVFKITANPGKRAKINGQLVANGYVTLSQGTTNVTWVDYDDTVHVTGVTLNKTSATLTVGETLTLSATVAPADATNKNVTWSSDNTAVATVENGVVTAKSAGTANIKVATADGGKTAVCVVTVNSANHEPDANAPTVRILNCSGSAGQRVAVDIMIENNPGIALVGFDISYDTDALTFKEAVCGTVFTESQMYMGNPDANPYSVLAYTTAEPNHNNGKLITLIFEIKEGCEQGSYDLEISNAEFYKLDDTPVDFEMINGCVNVVDHTPGDITGDGNVNMQDLLCLAKYFAGWDVEIDPASADVTGDGVLDIRDVLRLAKYFAGWQVEIF